MISAVIGLTTPNPTSVGQKGRAARSPEGIVGLDRPEGMLDLAAVLRADNGVDVSEGKIAPHVNTFGDQPSTFGAERLPMCMAAQLFAKASRSLLNASMRHRPDTAKTARKILNAR